MRISREVLCRGTLSRERPLMQVISSFRHSVPSTRGHFDDHVPSTRGHFDDHVPSTRSPALVTVKRQHNVKSVDNQNILTLHASVEKGSTPTKVVRRDRIFETSWLVDAFRGVGEQRVHEHALVRTTFNIVRQPPTTQRGLRSCQSNGWARRSRSR
jgi:hypothetical protein